MAGPDQGDYIVILIQGAQKVLIASGRKDLADKVHKLFTATIPGVLLLALRSAAPWRRRYRAATLLTQGGRSLIDKAPRSMEVVRLSFVIGAKSQSIALVAGMLGRNSHRQGRTVRHDQEGNAGRGFGGTGAFGDIVNAPDRFEKALTSWNHLWGLPLDA